MNKVVLKDLCKKGEIGKYGIPASAEDFDESKFRYLRISDIDDDGNSLDNVKKSVSSDDIEKYILNEGDLVVARTFADCPINLPDRNQQEILAIVLSDLDAKIELNNCINRELEAMAKTLYDYWFVQFDFPFNVAATSLSNQAQGKLNEQGEVAERRRSYKSSGGKMVYNAELKGEIPDGWEMKTLLDIATYINGFACQNYRPTNENHLPVIKIRDTTIVKQTKPTTLLSLRLVVAQVNEWAGGYDRTCFEIGNEQYLQTYY